MSDNNSAIVSKVWSFCNTLRDDGVGYGDYLEQLTYLLFLKMADEYTKPPHNRYRKVLALGKYPNTFMKIPGFGEMCSLPNPLRKPFPFENVPPLIEMAIEAFGAQLLMWGSNFPPVAGRGEGYRNSLRLPMEHVKFKSQEDKEWVFGKTASTLFRFCE